VGGLLVAFGESWVLTIQSFSQEHFSGKSVKGEVEFFHDFRRTERDSRETKSLGIIMMPEMTVKLSMVN